MARRVAAEVGRVRLREGAPGQGVAWGEGEVRHGDGTCTYTRVQVHGHTRTQIHTIECPLTLLSSYPRQNRKENKTKKRTFLLSCVME